MLAGPDNGYTLKIAKTALGLGTSNRIAIAALQAEIDAVESLGLLPYTHTQNTPSSLWVVDHMLNRRITSWALWINNQIVLADLDYITDDQVTVTFRYNNVGILKVW